MVLADVILLGAGVGKRYQSDRPKQFHTIEGSPVFLHSLKSLLTLDCVRNVVVVFPKELAEEGEKLITESLGPHRSIHVITGGLTRQDSSRLGLQAVSQFSPPCERVLIHDASRPYLSSSFLNRIRKVIQDKSFAAWVPVIPLADTLKRVEGVEVIQTVDRHALYRAQTPQIFDYALIQSLVSQFQNAQEFTDDASLCEFYKIPVATFEGDMANLKLTYPFEAEMLAPLLRQQKESKSCVSDSVTISTA